MHLQLQACKQRCKQTPKMHKRPLSTSFLGSDSDDSGFEYCTAQNFDGGNIDKFDEFPAIRQYFPYQNFPFS